MLKPFWSKKGRLKVTTKELNNILTGSTGFNKTVTVADLENSVGCEISALNYASLIYGNTISNVPIKWDPSQVPDQIIIKATTSPDPLYIICSLSMNIGLYSGTVYVEENDQLYMIVIANITGTLNNYKASVISYPIARSVVE